MYSQLLVVGNLGADVELRMTNDGTPVADLRVAANRKYTNSAGELVEETTWYTFTVWRQLAENCAQYLSKGRGVLIEGRLKPEIRIWVGQDGEPRAGYEATATMVKFLSGGNGGSTTPTQAPPVEEAEIPF